MATITTDYQLIYLSRSVDLPSSEDLLGILTPARQRNKLLGITGMLLYKDKSFLQVLEGHPDAIGELFDSIRKDERHCHIQVLLENDPIEQRTFPDWSMGFQNLSKQSIHHIKGFSNFFEPGYNQDSIEDATGVAVRLLHHFRKKS